MPLLFHCIARRETFMRPGYAATCAERLSIKGNAGIGIGASAAGRGMQP